MNYAVRTAKQSDLERIEEIYSRARDFMKEHGNPNQWGSSYPSARQIRQDITENKLFVIAEGSDIHGVFFFWIGEDPTYRWIDGGTWRADSAYGTIHRIAGDGSGGILKTAICFAEGYIGHLRIDTHADNIIMQRAVARLGFQRRGMIYLEDGSLRIAYDYLKAEKENDKTGE